MKSGECPPDKSKINLKITYASPTLVNFIQNQKDCSLNKSAALICEINPTDGCGVYEIHPQTTVCTLSPTLGQLRARCHQPPSSWHRQSVLSFRCCMSGHEENSPLYTATILSLPQKTGTHSPYSHFATSAVGC